MRSQRKKSLYSRAIIEMGSAANPRIHDTVTLMLYAIFPFNLLKHAATCDHISDLQAPDGSICRFLGRQGAVLAAGDYSHNPEMCRDLLAESDDLIDGGDWSGHGWDGSGIRMGVWAGGRLESRSHAAMGGNYSFPGFDLIGSAATLRVNCHGRRYSNEGFGTHILAAAAGAKQPNGMLWGIFDSSIEDELTWQAHCLHCGDCFRDCLVGAVKKIGETV